MLIALHHQQLNHHPILVEEQVPIADLSLQNHPPLQIMSRNSSSGKKVRILKQSQINMQNNNLHFKVYQNK